MNILDNRTPEEKETIYQHFLSLWAIAPEFVKHKFLREQQCILCDSCIAHVKETQDAVKADKLAKQTGANDTNDFDLPLI